MHHELNAKYATWIDHQVNNPKGKWHWIHIL
jgi:hypothetical protein